MVLWQWSLLFVLGGSVLVVAGVALAEAGDEIAERTGLGRMVVGALLVAGATSLPEVVTDVSAVLVDAPDIAIGDLFGSSMANMAILAIVDLVYRGRVWSAVELGHARVAAVGIALTGIAVLGVLSPESPAAGWVGAHTVVIVVVYVGAVAWIRRSPQARFARREPALPVTDEAEQSGGRGMRRPVMRFAGASVAILVSAPVVAVAGQGIARESGIGETFVGVLLVAVSTSLPELVASLAAVRMGAYDLAVGNVYGSNAFNMTIIVFVDLAYTDGPVLSAVDPSQAVAGVGAIALMALSLAAIVHGEETKIRRFEPDAVLVLAGYVAILTTVFAAG